jgi:RHS repeat-associated protein
MLGAAQDNARSEIRMASHYRARYYDPNAGRFFTEDPTGFNAGLNFYSYVKNDATNLTDPTGLYSLQGFSPTESAQMSIAIGKVWAKLLQCPSCVPDALRAKLLNMLQPGSYGSGVSFAHSNRPGVCGIVAGAFNFYLNRIEITSAAFGDPSCPCPLPGTIVHELVHLTWGSVLTPNPQREKDAHGIAAKCFGKACEGQSE